MYVAICWMSAYAAFMQVRTAIELGGLIRRRRREQGLSQLQLARKVGVSRQWISAMEHGKASAEIGPALRTLTALGLVADIGESRIAHGDVDLDELLGRADG
jgi:HTH-type transcriptional regulator / antitoxin HipB